MRGGEGFAGAGAGIAAGQGRGGGDNPPRDPAAETQRWLDVNQAYRDLFFS